MPEREYDVENEDIEKLLNTLARIIKQATPDGWGFALLMFDISKQGSMFYISSAERKSMIEAMQEFVRYQKSKGR